MRVSVKFVSFCVCVLSCVLWASVSIAATTRAATLKTRPVVKQPTVAKTTAPANKALRMKQLNLRNKKLLSLGQTKAAKEATLGVDPRMKGKKPTGEGTAPEEGPFKAVSKTPVIRMKQRMLSPKNSFKVQKDQEFTKPLVTTSRKSVFTYKGIGQINVKSVKFNPTDLSPVKVPSIRKDIPSAIKGAKIVVEDQRPDLYIDRLERIDDHGHPIALNSVRKSSAGMWLRFRIYIKNAGKSRAYRFDVTAEHLGRDWPTEDIHIVRSANGTHAVVVRVFIPQTAVVRDNHKLVFKVDPHRVNQDKNWMNNKKVLSFNLLAPIEPDLYFAKFERKKVDSHRDWGAISRGWIKYKYNLEIGNRGNAASPATNLRFKVQKVDNRDNHPAPWLHKDWSYPIPALGQNRKHALSTGKWKVYVAQQCRVDAVIDDQSRVVELSKENNHRSSEFSVSVKNPFAGTFLEGLFEAAYDAFLEMGNAVYDGVTWAYNGLKAASQYALAGIICPEMIAWVETSYGIHRPQARNLNAHEKSVLLPLYPDNLVHSTKIQVVNSWTRPELWGDGAGVTFSDGFTGHSVFVIERGKLNDSILVHEMVHAYQYKKLGLAGFCWEYIYSWVKSGFSYRGISLEKQAYAYQAYVNGGGTDTIETYLGY